ncbi:hypothetical protein jhhlp_000812 [Lomentospora prolificans]|uniref:Uncharacterized protein n=1 Tax=Lomentospora prolificans TaxID=41688 RepID=A0A2N3NJK6_9PEZI|nr:hypothetical protein jhhlp_000812 [Lomentospora prolificans]
MASIVYTPSDVIGCYVLMAAVKLVLDVGLQGIPGVDAANAAVQLIFHAYPPGEDPVGDFEWWLSPCGGSDPVPDDINQVFDILNPVADGVSSFRMPQNIRKGSGKIAVHSEGGAGTSLKHHYVIASVEFGSIQTTVAMQCEKHFS